MNALWYLLGPGPKKPLSPKAKAIYESLLKAWKETQ